MADTRLKIAVFIDFDNIEIGVKSTLGVQFDIGVVLEALKERGDVVSKIAYGDWTRAGDYSRSLTQHATKLVQRNLTPGGDKNGADINLALDALEMAFTHGHINAYVIVGGDSDFISLVEKLKQYDKQIFVVGGRAFTSLVMQRNCHEFIAYENLTGSRRFQDRGQKSAPSTTQQAPLDQVLPLVRRALKVLTDREVTPQLGLLKSTLLQLDSTFSERTYGAGSFRDFAQKLSAAGHVVLRESGRNVLVELSDTVPVGSSATSSGQASFDKLRAAASTSSAQNGEDGRPQSSAEPIAREAAVGDQRDRCSSGGWHSRGPAAVPDRPACTAMADVYPAVETVSARSRCRVRRAQVRFRDARRSDEGLSEGWAPSHRTRSSGRHAYLPWDTDARRGRCRGLTRACRRRRNAGRRRRRRTR